MADLEKTKQLLKDVNRIVKHHKEIAKIKGEDFNIFKILRVQTKEVKTHSRFLAELLNPKGAHHFGSTFLELFFKEINSLEKEIQVKANNETRVIVEYHISNVNLVTSQGGSIDILIKDKENNTISIENKIYAGDQEQQVLRYVNYNKDKNTVYYLTLFGNEPNNKSITDTDGNKLKSGKDYMVISYKNHILPWLELCLKEATEKPILRESIKQYIILIKKLTYTLNMAEKKEITDVIFKNLAEAKYIAKHYSNIIEKHQAIFRTAVFNKLKSSFELEDYNVTLGNDTSKKFSQIWIKLKKNKNYKLWFGIESFTGLGHYNGDLFVGIFNREHNSEFQNKTDTSLSKTWHLLKKLSYKNKIINLSHVDFLQKLHKNDKYDEIVNEVSDQIIDFITENKNEFLKFSNEY